MSTNRFGFVSTTVLFHLATNARSAYKLYVYVHMY